MCRKKFFNERLKILFLSSRIPYPLGGDRLKNFWLLKILSKHFKVHLVSIAEEKIPPDFYRWAKSIGITYKIFKKTKWQFYLNATKGLLNTLPLQVNFYYFTDIQKYINKISKKFDFIFATLIRTALYVERIDKPKIIELTDSIGLNYKRSAEKTRSFFWKYVYKFEANRVIEFEKRCIEKFDKCLFVNKFEAEYYKNPEKVIWLPNGVDKNLVNYKKLNPKYRNCIVFYGKMNYQPNIDAVLWFCENVLNKVESKLKFLIIGAYPTKKILNLSKKYKNVKVLGFVDDPYEILQNSLVLVAPMQTGAGIQNKILEAMAVGSLVVTTSLSAKGILGAKNYEHFIVEDSPDKMAEIINCIYKNSQEYEKIRKNARDFIKNNYTWSIYEKRLLEIINEVIRK